MRVSRRSGRKRGGWRARNLHYTSPYISFHARSEIRHRTCETASYLYSPDCSGLWLAAHGSLAPPTHIPVLPRQPHTPEREIANAPYTTASARWRTSTESLRSYIYIYFRRGCIPVLLWTRCGGLLGSDSLRPTKLTATCEMAFRLARQKRGIKSALPRCANQAAWMRLTWTCTRPLALTANRYAEAGREPSLRGVQLQLHSCCGWHSIFSPHNKFTSASSKRSATSWIGSS